MQSYCKVCGKYYSTNSFARAVLHLCDEHMTDKDKLDERYTIKLIEKKKKKEKYSYGK